MPLFDKTVLYFFSPLPGRNFSYYIIMGIIAILMIAGGIFIKVYSKSHKDNKSFKKLFQPYTSKLWITASLIIAYLLCRYYYVTFFSMRVLMFILLAITVYLIYSITDTYLKIYPKDKEERAKKIEMNKWIPGKKNKRK